VLRERGVAHVRLPRMYGHAELLVDGTSQAGVDRPGRELE
jgi:hypothetical protein